MTKTIIPFGPQHPVLPEPIHLQLTLEDEMITDVIPALGFVHRGLEKLVAIRDMHQMIQVVERVCGICSMIHAMCYAQGLETIRDWKYPLGPDSSGSSGRNSIVSTAISSGLASLPTALVLKASLCRSGRSGKKSWI